MLLEKRLNSRYISKNALGINSARTKKEPRHSSLRIQQPSESRGTVYYAGKRS